MGITASSVVAASRNDVFAWHERPGALTLPGYIRLAPALRRGWTRWPGTMRGSPAPTGV